MTLDVYFRQCVGIDISKDKFTACLYMYDRASDVGCCTKSIDFANTKSGFNQMVRWSRKEAVKSHPLTYLMEPTGVYYERLAYHLHKIGQTVYVVLPNKARKFCESEGIKTKTDAMDARCLALMGCVSRKLKPWSPPAQTFARSGHPSQTVWKRSTTWRVLPSPYIRTARNCYRRSTR